MILTWIWTLAALLGLLVCLINLMDALADNAALRDDTRHSLGDLQGTGRVIAFDNAGREGLVLLGLLACLLLGVMALFPPEVVPPPTRALFAVVCLLIVEACLVGISMLGRVRRINARRLLDLAIRARAEATSSQQQAAVATSVATSIAGATHVQEAIAAATPTPESATTTKES